MGKVARQLTIGLLLAVASIAAISRSSAERAKFIRHSPCPSTGLHRGSCPGWEVDHIVPLCAGGADRTSNMQWLTVSDHRKKTTIDRRVCRRLG